MGARERLVGTDIHSAIPPGVPGIAEIAAQAGDENFPVALALLGRTTRADLAAIYGFARLADDLGDDYEGDRLAALDWLEDDLQSALTGDAQHPVVQHLARVITERDLDLAPLRDLIEANRRDQRQRSYQTFDELLDYCTLSANPVGRLVLAVFDASTPDRIALSDQVCSGLQVVEHLQDVTEDLARGRVYLPAEDLERFGCTVDDLRAPAGNEQVRRLVAFEAGRARQLLDAAGPLSRSLPPRPACAVAGFAGGGHAALDAIAAANYDVLGHSCRPAKRRVAFHVARILGFRWHSKGTDAC